jgi:hypothetical protein
VEELLDNADALEDWYYVKSDRATACLKTTLGHLAEMDASQAADLDRLPRVGFITEGEKLDLHDTAYWVVNMLKYTVDMAV